MKAKHDQAKERGRHWGAYFREQGIDYWRQHDLYQSNPYPAGSKEAKAYDDGYEEGFGGTDSQRKS
mgnify:CR=1 FL=1